MRLVTPSRGGRQSQSRYADLGNWRWRLLFDYIIGRLHKWPGDRRRLGASRWQSVTTIFGYCTARESPVANGIIHGSAGFSAGTNILTITYDQSSRLRDSTTASRAAMYVWSRRLHQTHTPTARDVYNIRVVFLEENNTNLCIIIDKYYNSVLFVFYIIMFIIKLLY